MVTNSIFNPSEEVNIVRDVRLSKKMLLNFEESFQFLQRYSIFARPAMRIITPLMTPPVLDNYGSFCS